MWRNRVRFLLFSLVIALITTLVLFTAALGEGLGLGNREYIEKLDADLLVFKRNVDLFIGASRIDRSHLNEIRRVVGVQDVGSISVANASLVLAPEQKLNIALIGVEPGRPGEPPVVTGRGLPANRGREAIIDRNVALRTHLNVGDEFRIRSIQGTREEFYSLLVVGITDGRQYFLQPSVFVPYLTWDQIKPGGPSPDAKDFTANVVAVRVADGMSVAAVRTRLESEVADIEAVDLKTAYEAAPGYAAQQSTLGTQRAFVLVIGVLVIGGFFQIQTLQKVPQIGMLKAIGASNATIGLAAITQIVLVTLLGVVLGSGGTLLLSLSFPPTIPIVFTANAVAFSVVALMLIGPLGGLVSVRYSLRVEPLTALGLSA
ncbi:MAG: ABC transporter permease [Chloroflexota bacterium]